MAVPKTDAVSRAVNMVTAKAKGKGILSMVRASQLVKVAGCWIYLIEVGNMQKKGGFMPTEADLKKVQAAVRAATKKVTGGQKGVGNGVTLVFPHRLLKISKLATRAGDGCVNVVFALGNEALNILPSVNDLFALRTMITEQMKPWPNVVPGFEANVMTAGRRAA